MGYQTAWGRYVAFALLVAAAVGCGRTGGSVQETQEFSFDEMAAQLAAEEALSKAERGEN